MEVAAMQATATPDAQGVEALTSDGGHLAGLGTPAVVPMAAPCGMGLAAAPSMPSSGQASAKARARGQRGLGSALPPDKPNACKVGRVLGSHCRASNVACRGFNATCKRGFRRAQWQTRLLQALAWHPPVDRRQGLQPSLLRRRRPGKSRTVGAPSSSRT